MPIVGKIESDFTGPEIDLLIYRTDSDVFNVCANFPITPGSLKNQINYEKNLAKIFSGSNILVFRYAAKKRNFVDFQKFETFC